MGEGNIMNVLKKSFIDECWDILMGYSGVNKTNEYNLRIHFIGSLESSRYSFVLEGVS